MVTVAWRHFFPWLQNLPPEVKYVIDQTTCMSYTSNISVSGPTIPPAAGFGLVHKKNANQIHQTLFWTKYIYHRHRERHLGSPSPYHSFQTFGVFEPVLFIWNSSNSGLPITIPPMNIVHPCQYYIASKRLSRLSRCQKLCANIVSRCGLGWHNQQTDISPLSSIFGQSFFSKSILPHRLYSPQKRADK